MPRIGLLECDYVSDRFRSIAGDYRDMFTQLFEGSESGLDLIPYDVYKGELPVEPDECDGWLSTGSRHSVYDEIDWIAGLSSFVRDVRASSRPFVGICFGHQVLAHALGGGVEPADTGWGVGVHQLEVVLDEPWMTPNVEPPGPRLHFMHQDQVTSLPEGGVLLGRADHCPIAMFQIGETMLGMQPHPEFVAPYVDALLAARRDRIGEERVDEARRSLSAPTDESAVARWIVGFLTAGA